MQAIAADQLTKDLAALVSHLMRSAGGAEVLQAVEEHELSFSQVKSLMVLFNCEEQLPLKEIGERLGLSLPAVSRAVDGLVSRGLATRTEDADDRRVKRVALTADGRDMVREIAAVRIAGLQAFVDTLSARERELLGAAVSVLAERPEITLPVGAERA